ncbi:unnamed protein product [marine sediment metagenome]|uniref:Uncharacterized protein n=1 Tax=marine sediment metagenome TaxID=412755 RepID=X1GMS6_9ZZZZ
MRRKSAPERVLETRIKDRKKSIAKVKKRMKENRAQDLHALRGLKKSIRDAEKKIAKLKKERK